MIRRLAILFRCGIEFWLVGKWGLGSKAAVDSGWAVTGASGGLLWPCLVRLLGTDLEWIGRDNWSLVHWTLPVASLEGREGNTSI